MVQTVRNLPSMQEAWVPSLAGEYPLEEGMATHSQYFSVLLPGKSNGQRSLEGYCPWGCKELGTTEWLTLPLSTFKSLNSKG